MNVINPVKLKQAVQYLNHGKDKERDIATLLMEISSQERKWFFCRGSLKSGAANGYYEKMGLYFFSKKL